MTGVLCGGRAHRLGIDHVLTSCDQIHTAARAKKKNKRQYGWDTVEKEGVKFFVLPLKRMDMFASNINISMQVLKFGQASC